MPSNLPIDGHSFRRVEFSAQQAPGASDNPQTDGFGPLLTLGYVDGDALPFRWNIGLYG